jgi:hypothetical protein
VSVDGVRLLKSFVPSSYDATRGLFYAGYEGRQHSLACLATSRDGLNWSTLATPADAPYRWCDHH